MVIGQSKMEELDDRFKASGRTCRERPIPERPVVDTGLGFGEPPRRPVPHDLYAEICDRDEIVLHVLVMSRLGELVLSIPLTLAHHDWVRSFFADRPDEVRKRIGVSHVGRVDRHRFASLVVADETTSSGRSSVDPSTSARDTGTWTRTT